MKKFLCFLFLLFAIILFYCLSVKQDEKNNIQTIEFATLTYGDETTRLENLEKAAERLNNDFAESGERIQINISTEYFPIKEGLEKYYQKIIQLYNDGNLPDVFLVGHEQIPRLAEKGMIIPVDEIRNSENYKDVYATLWQSVQYDGHTWGVLQDTDVAMIYINKKVLENMGWSEEAILQLKDGIEQGKITVYDLTEIAKEALELDLVEYGILHRPTKGNGQFFYMLADQFNVHKFSDDTLYFNRNNLLRFLDYLYQLTQVSSVAPDDIFDMSWDDTYKKINDGSTLFWFGAVYNMFDLIRIGGNYDMLMDTYIFSLYPAEKEGEKAVSVSHPYVYVISSQCENPEEAVLLMEKVGMTAFQVNHALKTYHLPIKKSAMDDEDFRLQKYLLESTYMLDHSILIPNNDIYEAYLDVLFDAIESVERGMLKPESAVLKFEDDIKKILQDKVVFE